MVGTINLRGVGAKFAAFFQYSEKEVTLWRCVKHSQPHHWRTTVQGTIVTVVLSLVPALTAAMILSVVSFPYSWNGFIENGEVAIPATKRTTYIELQPTNRIQRCFGGVV